MAARDRDGHGLAVLVDIAHGAGILVAGRDRHLQHVAGLGAKRQEGAVGRLPLRPQRRQDDLHDHVVVAERVLERLVEFARSVRLGRTLEGVGEAEVVEEGAEPGIVVGAETLVGAEGVRNPGQRLAEMLLHHRPVRDVVGHLAQRVHVVGEGHEARRDVAHRREGVAHHGRARDLGEGADVGQARGTVAGLEERIPLRRRRAADALQQGRGLLERPGLGVPGERPKVVCGVGHGRVRMPQEHAPGRRRASTVSAFPFRTETL